MTSLHKGENTKEQVGEEILEITGADLDEAEDEEISEITEANLDEPEDEEISEITEANLDEPEDEEISEITEPDLDEPEDEEISEITGHELDEPDDEGISEITGHELDEPDDEEISEITEHELDEPGDEEISEITEHELDEPGDEEISNIIENELKESKDKEKRSYTEEKNKSKSSKKKFRGKRSLSLVFVVGMCLFAIGSYYFSQNENGKKIISRVNIFPIPCDPSFIFESFIIPFQKKQGYTYISLDLSFELSSMELKKEIIEKKDQLRGVIYELLSQEIHTVDDARSLEELKALILKKANNILTSGEVHEAIITEFSLV
jgi:flagellar basal body-associated protein FliL